jgi:hypothetical protein
MSELIEKLEVIESMLNEDNPNISDIRVELAMLLIDLTSKNSTNNADLEADLMDEDERWNSAGVEISYDDIQINGC